MNGELEQTWSEASWSYLYCCRAPESPFYEIQEDMAQLNDFCVGFLDVTLAKIEDLNSMAERGKGGDFTGDDGEVLYLTDDEVRESAEVQLEVWHHTYDFLARANCLLLLACFTEKSLASLCSALGERIPRAKPGQNKISACLEFLRIECGLSFEEPEESVGVREQCRKVRNAFAHGEWQETETLVGEMPLAKAFRAVSELISSIEHAHAARKIAEDRGRVDFPEAGHSSGQL